MIFLNQPVGAMTGFPNNNTPGDKATYKFTLKVPTTISGGAAAAVSNGGLASSTVSGTRTDLGLGAASRWRASSR